MYGDNLFVITATDTHSFKFSILSVLSPNMQKSNVYIAGVDEEMSKELCKIVNMPRGHLSFTYACHLFQQS